MASPLMVMYQGTTLLMPKDVEKPPGLSPLRDFSFRCTGICEMPEKTYWLSYDGWNTTFSNHEEIEASA